MMIEKPTAGLYNKIVIFTRNCPFIILKGFSIMKRILNY